ncbi:hypothetical protein N2152v2_010449 [Parachlorella kessleri]
MQLPQPPPGMVLAAPGMAALAAHGMAGLAGPAGWHISLDWSEDEQRTLEEHLARFPPERYDALQRYVKLAAMLPRKSVRDVALRCKWTLHQQMLRKRKLEQGGGGKGPMGMAAKKPAGAKPPLMPMPLPVSGVGGPVPGTVPPPFLPPGSQPPGSSGAPAAGTAAASPSESLIVDGPIAQLLETNYGILNTFRANMSGFKVAENTQLLMEFRDNILSIISHMENMGGVMDQMPQLPVRLNVDLANSFLPSRSSLPTPAAYAAVSAGLPPQPTVNIPGMVPLNGIGTGSNAAPPPSSAPLPAVGIAAHQAAGLPQVPQEAPGAAAAAAATAGVPQPLAGGSVPLSAVPAAKQEQGEPEDDELDLPLVKEEPEFITAAVAGAAGDGQQQQQEQQHQQPQQQPQLDPQGLRQASKEEPS